MLQLVCPPNEDAYWCIPPLFDNGNTAKGNDWKWDLRPECSYWLSLKGFNPKYRTKIQQCVFVEKWITCPYFTIEFKRDGQSEDVTIVQVTASGSLALYNRYCLHDEALRVSKNSWKPED